MPAAPPVADTRKPATPAPSKAGSGADKTAGDKPTKSAGETAPKAGAAGQHDKTAPAPAQAPGKGGAGSAGAGGQQRFDRMAVRAKLVVSEPGDALEREADAVAARVMRKPAPEVVPAKDLGQVADPDRVQRAPAAAQMPEEHKQGAPGGNKKAAALPGDKKPAPNPEQKSGPQARDKAAAPRADEKKAPAAESTSSPADKQIQLKASDAPANASQAPPTAAGNAPSTPAELIARLGHGAALDSDARAFFEQRLGRDLSDVRIHDDAAAADAARALQARAFTWGCHIAFASGEYRPASEAGRELLAHELAHVLQNDGAGLANVVARKPDNPKYKDPNDIGKDAFDPAMDTSARPALETLKLPEIKARHADYYRKLAGKSLKRPAGYDRKTPPFKTEQVKKWKEAIDLAAYYAGIGFVPGNGRQTLTFYGARNRILSGTEGELIEQMKVPKWTPDGSWLASPLQVDHIVEVQVSGIDAFDNYELLTGAHNTNVGSVLRASIYANVKGYLAATEKNTGDALVKRYLDENDIDFKKVEGGAAGKNPESTAQFWSREQISGGKHLAWLKDEERAKTDDGSDKSRFALYSYTGAGFIDAFPLSKNIVTLVDSGRLAGIKLGSLVLNPDFETASGGAIGRIKGDWVLPVGVKANKGKTFESALNAVPDKKYAGALASLTPPETEVDGASPVAFEAVDFVRGKLSADGVLTTSHPLFPGVQIPVRWRGGDFAFEHTFSIDELAGKLPIPGVTIDDASLTLFFGTRGLGADGSIAFTIKGFGAGLLSLGIQNGAHGPDLTAKGKLIADRKLFDLATIEIGYSKALGFFGNGTLGITNPEKIKGIKSARLSARYAQSAFTATGDVSPDIPGLKSASLSVKYADDTLQITGKLGIDDKVPGVEKADISVEVKQDAAGWKVAAGGDVTPKLPGLAGSTLKFAYDDGFVLIEGEFTLKKGPLDGTVTAGVTNAAVDEFGKRADKGEGKSFKVFGSADIKAEFVKDKLAGKLKLRLLPDGSVRVGGGLEVGDFDVFGKLPEDGAEFLNKSFRTPSVPLPGLGFSVGSVSVGITFSASVTIKAHASIGPGRMTGITLTVEEFDPAHIDFNALEIGGGASFVVLADAGFGVGAKINLEFSAVVARLVGSVGAEATVGLPTDKPLLKAASRFTYSQAKGLDIMNTLSLAINPELKFRLFGEVSAELNLLIDTLTLWSKDWTLAEANYKLPVGINASGELGYNSLTGKLRPENPSDAIKIEQPKIDADAMKGVVSGDTAPASVKTVDAQHKELPPEELVCVAPVEPDASFPLDEPNQSLMPKREDDAPGRAPAVVDEGIVAQLGTGAALDFASRGYFEQRLGINLSGVRVHTGPGAALEARRLGARAFTVGEHIAFADGEYQPQSLQGQELIAHELVHVAQQQGGVAEPIVMRWPAVTRLPAQTSETPATVRAGTLSDFVILTRTQLDWATSPALQADAAALGQFRSLQTFADAPNIAGACGLLPMGDIIAEGLPGVFPALRKYSEGVMTSSTAWLRQTADIHEAERWGTELTMLEGAWPAANLSLVMRAPDPVTADSPFEMLDDPASPELGNFISYLTACKPILSADDGSEVDSFLDLRDEGAAPASYKPKVSHVRNYHHFTKATLDGLAVNEAFPQWFQQSPTFQLPLTVVLYPAVDHNGAFHRNKGLEAMVTNASMLTIVVEGKETVADYRSELAPVASRYGAGGKIQQAMIAGHGNSTILVLAGTAGATIAKDSLQTWGPGGTSTTDLMTELTRLMSGDPAKRRIVLDACLTSSHHVASALRASPADAAADVNAAIAGDPSLRDFVAGLAGAGSSVIGSSSSFVPAQTRFLAPGMTDLTLSVPGDPDLAGSKIEYVEFGTEPEGCMRAVLECWATDQIAGTHDCADAIRRRIGAGQSAHVPAAATWRESIIQPLYALAVNHYWGSGESLRRMGELAGSLFELKWKGHTSAATLVDRLGVIAGTPAHVDRLLSKVAAEPHYAATPRVAIVIEQAWMQTTPARRVNFIKALGRYMSAKLAFADLDMALVMPHVASLLTRPPPVPPAPEQLLLALLAAHYSPVGTPPPSPLPAQADFLRSLLGAGPSFPAALDVPAALGGLTVVETMLSDIGRPLAPQPRARRAPGPPPTANLDPERDASALNDFAVTPLRRNGQVATVRDNLMVRSTPTTSTWRNIFARLPGGTSVRVIGETGAWYAIEQPGRSGFVAKRYIKLVP